MQKAQSRRKRAVRRALSRLRELIPENLRLNRVDITFFKGYSILYEIC